MKKLITALLVIFIVPNIYIRYVWGIDACHNGLMNVLCESVIGGPDKVYSTFSLDTSLKPYIVARFFILDGSDRLGSYRMFYSTPSWVTGKITFQGSYGEYLCHKFFVITPNQNGIYKFADCDPHTPTHTLWIEFQNLGGYILLDAIEAKEAKEVYLPLVLDR